MKQSRNTKITCLTIKTRNISANTFKDIDFGLKIGYALYQT